MRQPVSTSQVVDDDDKKKQNTEYALLHGWEILRNIL